MVNLQDCYPGSTAAALRGTLTVNTVHSSCPVCTSTLSWWARTDPLFFIVTIGILEGRLEKDDSEGACYDSFLRAAGIAGIAREFVEPMRQHAKVNAGHDHGSVSREFFAALPPLPAGTRDRLVGKAHLFVEAYAEFFNGILEYYSDPYRPLVRTINPSSSAGVDNGRS